MHTVRYLHLIKSLLYDPLLPGPFKKAYDKQQYNSAYCCYHQVPDNSAGCAKSKCAEDPASQKRPNHSNNQVYEQAKPPTFLVFPTNHPAMIPMIKKQNKTIPSHNPFS